jgi:hypothetical protein
MNSGVGIEVPGSGVARGALAGKAGTTECVDVKCAVKTCGGGGSVEIGLPSHQNQPLR